MKTLLRAAAVLTVLGVLALVACSQKGFNTNLTIEPKPTPGVDWSKYKTWSFGRQGEYVLTHNDVLDSPNFRKAVGDHTVAEMNNLGYEHVNSNPDMLIMFHVIIEQRFDEVKNNPAYEGFDMQWAHSSEDDTWQEGSLILFAIDAKTGQQIWMSTAKAELDKRSNFETKKRRFNQVVTEMLSDFPKHTM
ncbi:MAG TPA: DUF4136 domain-containing protein [Candidatus Krumholzibacteria bacterium]|nr:DUF4136 domain-containing protein [Candidatus Krumholzibacteria bacterium]